jgi:hypothetical protein
MAANRQKRNNGCEKRWKWNRMVRRLDPGEKRKFFLPGEVFLQTHPLMGGSFSFLRPRLEIYCQASFMLRPCISGFRTFISRLHTFRFIIDETKGTKQLIKSSYQMLKRFMPNSSCCNWPVVAIISKTMKRYLDKLEISLYYNNIFISQL